MKMAKRLYLNIPFLFYWPRYLSCTYRLLILVFIRNFSKNIPFLLQSSFRIVLGYKVLFQLLKVEQTCYCWKNISNQTRMVDVHYARAKNRKNLVFRPPFRDHKYKTHTWPLTLNKSAFFTTIILWRIVRHR